MSASTARRARAILFALVIALASGLLGGCGPLRDSPVAAVRAPIVNGVPDPGHPSVGMVRVGNALCTGTLVGHRTVLTAAHCIMAGQAHTFVLGKTTYNAAQAIPHAQYDPSTTGVNDVALLRLNQAPTVGYSRVASKPIGISTSITLVGFGVTTDDGKDSGTKRKGDNRVFWKTSDQYGYFTTLGSWAQTCFGDSGGPSFAVVDGQVVVVGVHSYVTYGCAASGFDMRMDAFLSWAKTAAQGDIATESSDPIVPPDDLPPSVQIVTPKDGSAVGADVDVKAAISDEGEIVEVRMLLDGNLTHKLTKKPYEFFFGGLSNGAHIFRVEADDKGGNTGQAEARVQVGSPPPKDTQPPSVVIARPAPGSRVGTTFPVAVEASDLVGVLSVELRINGTLHEKRDKRPFVFIVEGAAPGLTQLDARAVDAAGNVGTANVSVDVVTGNEAAGDDAGGCRVGRPPDRGPALPLVVILLLMRVRRGSKSSPD